MDLGGRWRAIESDDERRRLLPEADLDDTAWVSVDVPGQWRSAPGLGASDGPVLYRRRFERSPPEPGRRSWLCFDGVFYQADVWLDGAYLGDTEGYFHPSSFEVTDQLRAGPDHLLAVEVTCAPPAELRKKRSLTGVFQHWDCLDPAWNPGGIWAPVRLCETGPVRLARLRVLCREATAERAVLELETGLDTTAARQVTLRTTVEDAGGAVVAASTDSRRVAAGTNRVRWRVVVERPSLWWPHALGDQPLYDVEVEVEAGGLPSDRRTLTTGLRRVTMQRWIVMVNGERLFLKGANIGPTRRALSEVGEGDVGRDLRLARDAGLDLLRVHAHVGHPRLYDLADRCGMLLWQDLPLQWGYGQVRRQATRQARQAVDLLGHHPSVALWCGHNEPFALDAAPGGALRPGQVARFAVAQAAPTWNKSVLDRSIRRALDRADGSRPVVAHSGVLPHPAWGTDTHAYFGWYHGDERDFPRALARWPALARFVSEFGAQSVPDSDAFLEPARWPDLDWDRLEDHHGLQKHIFDRRVPPGGSSSFAAWRRATQQYQADVVRYHVETLRRLKYRPTGGFCVFLLADAQPAVSWSLVDHDRNPKLAYDALRAACAPVVVVADRLRAAYRPGETVDAAVHVVSDLRRDLTGAVVTASLRWPGGGRTWRFAGDVAADRCTLVGKAAAAIPPDTTAGALLLSIELAAAGLGPLGPVGAEYASSVAGGPAPGR
jgi:beta-mannosidase